MPRCAELAAICAARGLVCRWLKLSRDAPQIKLLVKGCPPVTCAWSGTPTHSNDTMLDRLEAMAVEMIGRLG